MRALCYKLLGAWVLCTLGCANLSGSATSTPVKVGEDEAALVARIGQPQEIQRAGDTKIYLYRSELLEPIAGMGGGVWSQPMETRYQVNEQGIITSISVYPYGKRTFLFTQKGKDPDKVPTPDQKPRKKEAKETKIQPSPEKRPAAIPSRAGKNSVAALELNLTQEEVMQLLGPPPRTEGFISSGKPLVIWFYVLNDEDGQPLTTPLVFHQKRLIGWGERYYRKIMP